QALASLGYRLEWDQTFEVTVHGAETIPHATGTVHAADSGTVARFALALAALADGETTFDASGRLRERPIAPLANAPRGPGAPSLDWITIKPQKVKPRSFAIPGDATAATYPAAAAAICGGSVTVENVDAHEIRGGQGDVRYFSMLEEMGCGVSRGKGSVTVER